MAFTVDYRDLHIFGTVFLYSGGRNARAEELLRDILDFHIILEDELQEMIGTLLWEAVTNPPANGIPPVS